MNKKNQKIEAYLRRKCKRVISVSFGTKDGIIELATSTSKRRFREDEEKMEEKMENLLGDKFFVEGVQYRLCRTQPVHRFVTLLTLAKFKKKK